MPLRIGAGADRRYFDVRIIRHTALLVRHSRSIDSTVGIVGAVEVGYAGILNMIIVCGIVAVSTLTDKNSGWRYKPLGIEIGSGQGPVRSIGEDVVIEYASASRVGVWIVGYLNGKNVVVEITIISYIKYITTVCCH